MDDSGLIKSQPVSAAPAMGVELSPLRRAGALSSSEGLPLYFPEINRDRMNWGYSEDALRLFFDLFGQVVL